MTASKKNLPVKLPSGPKQVFDHLGFEYDVKAIVEHMRGDMKPKDAFLIAYPETPKASIANIVKKLKKHPYYIAKVDLTNDVLRNQAAELQQNLLGIAFEGKSERNRLDATNSALDRIGIGAKEDEQKEPQYVFNFNFGQTAPPKPEIMRDGKIIEGEEVK